MQHKQNSSIFSQVLRKSNFHPSLRKIQRAKNRPDANGEALKWAEGMRRAEQLPARMPLLSAQGPSVDEAGDQVEKTIEGVQDGTISELNVVMRFTGRLRRGRNNP